MIGCLSNVLTGKFRKNFNESHWANPDICDIYERAKFFVEKCAWNYQESNKKKFKLTVFLPGLLVGPLKKKGEHSTSVVFFKKIIKKNLQRFINIKIPVVDVRDVTKIVVMSVRNVSSFNQRYILNEGVYWLQEIINIFSQPLSNNLEALQQVQNGNVSFVSKMLMKFLSFFDKDLKKILVFADKNFNVQNDKSRKDFSIEYTSHLKALEDMRQSFIDFGYIKREDGAKTLGERKNTRKVDIEDVSQELLSDQEKHSDLYIEEVKSEILKE